MRRSRLCGWGDGMRGALLVVMLLLGSIGTGCIRHQSQIESMRADRPVVAPEKGGTLLAEVVE